jgi:Insect cuticle protein
LDYSSYKVEVKHDYAVKSDSYGHGHGADSYANHNDGSYKHDDGSYKGEDDGSYKGEGGSSYHSEASHGHHGHESAGHGHEEHYPDHHPSYKFEYGVKDPKTGDHKSQWETRNGDVVKGEYTLDEADGTHRIVEYSSDKKNGFNAVVKKIGHASHH